MANINEILARAAALRDETALNSISPERAGGIMYDTLLALNELWLQQGSALVISKIYASVAAMEADSAPVSDLTGQPLRPGQIVVIASSDSDNGSVYRYNGIVNNASSWTLVGAIGNLDPVDSLDSDSTTLPLAAHQGKVLDGKINQLGQEVDDLNVQINGGEAYVPVELNLQQGYFNTQVGSAPYKIQDTRTPLADYMCAELQVAPGDHFKISGDNYGVYIQRLWAFADADNNRLTYADNTWHQSTMLVDEEIIAPANAVRLVVNFRNYDASTCGLKKLSQSEGLKERVSDCEEAINSKPYDGKTILCLGDSITEGIAKVAEAYPYYLQQLLGGNVINCGVGGTRCTARTTITPTTTSGAYAAFDFVNLAQAIANNDYTTLIACGEYLKNNAGVDTPLAVANRLAQIDWSKIDFIVVAYGVNDWINGVLLGDITDGNEDELVPKYSDTEFCGAWNKGLHYILSAYPHIKVVLMTNPVGYRTDDPYSSSFRAARWGSNYKKGNGATLEGYANATIEVARYNTLPVFDFYHNCGWNRDNFAKYYLQSDGVTVNTIHPASGYDYMAHKLASWILSQWI